MKFETTNTTQSALHFKQQHTTMVSVPVVARPFPRVLDFLAG